METMANEIWKDINGYENVYQISNYGRVKSLTRSVNNANGVRQIKEKILRPKFNDRYPIIDLSFKGVIKTKYIHRLVAETFLEKPETKCEVNHKNLIKTDNTVYNLEWINHTENMNHYYSFSKTHK